MAGTGQYNGLRNWLAGSILRGSAFVRAGRDPNRKHNEPGVSAWGRADARTYKAVSDAFILFNSAPNPPVPGFQRGTQRITQSIQVNDNQLTSVASTQFFDLTGNLLMTGCATATGQRFND